MGRILRRASELLKKKGLDLTSYTDPEEEAPDDQKVFKTFLGA
jgi:hypothetical protein